MKHSILSICITLAAGTAGIAPLAAQTLNITRTAGEYDTLAAAWAENNSVELFEQMFNDYVNLDSTTYIPAMSPFTESQYIERLNSVVSPVEIPYNNIIHQRIVAYTTTHQATTKRMLGQSQYYFPLIEHELALNGLPLELKFIPVIESALQPAVRSRAGAAGLWQFMLATARQYGLEVSTMVDERNDPVKSTQAACRMLKDLYNIYEDWTLVMAAYNYGPGSVNRAIARAGGGVKTYWDIYPYLPAETRNYVPSFVAVLYAYHFYKLHDITPNEPTIPLATDTVMIDRNLHFEQVSSTMNVPTEVIKMLNPMYLRDIVPGKAKPYPLVLPQQEISNFIALEQEIFAKDSIYIDPRYSTNIAQAGSFTAPAGGTVYTVKSGDTLGHIAQRYSTTVSRLKQWNGLTSDRLRVGQKLVVST